MKVSKAFIIITLTIGFLFSQSCNSNNDDENNDNEKSVEELIHDKLGETGRFEEMHDTLQVAHMVRVWNGCHNAKFIEQLSELYAGSLFFYGENRSMSEALSVKRRLFQTYPDYFQRIIGGIKVSKLNAIEYKAEFTKYISVGKITAPVPAYMILQKVGDNKWVIIAESDPETDVKTKEMKDSMQTLMEMYTPSMTEIKGNFSGKGNETIYIFPPDDPKCTECVTSLFFSNELLPPIDIAGAKSAQLYNEGDLDGDGIEEFSVLSNIGGQGQIIIYSFKRGAWKSLKQFRVNYDQLIQNVEDRKNVVQLAGSGYIYIQEWTGDTVVQQKINIWDY